MYRKFNKVIYYYNVGLKQFDYKIIFMILIKVLDFFRNFLKIITLIISYS